MAAVTDQDIVSRFAALSIAAPPTLTHAAVAGGAEWRAELDKLGKSGVALTKTVSGVIHSPLTAAPLQAQDGQDC
jgi:prolyl-tRNA synthetase